MTKTYGRTFRKRKKKVINYNDHVMHEQFNLLCKWMGEKAHTSGRRLRPKTFKDTGRGLMAVKGIQPGDIIVSIPKNLLVTPESVLQSDLGRLFANYLPSASGQQILSIFLALERTVGKNSKWFTYIRSLPETYNIPAFYGEKCLWFFPSFLKDLARKQIQVVKESYAELQLLLKHLNEFNFTGGSINYSSYIWAWCSVNTRSVYMNCDKPNCVGKSCSFHLALAPFLDMLNHSVDVQVQAGFNRNSNEYEIVSLCNTKKHCQVFINYGPHDNRKLLIEYGFVVPKNVNDAVQISFNEVLSAYQKVFVYLVPASKVYFITENDLTKDLSFSTDGASWNLNLILRILCSEHNIELWSKNIFNTHTFSTDEEAKFQKLLKALIICKLNQYSCPTEAHVYSKKYEELKGQVSQLMAIEKSILEYLL